MCFRLKWWAPRSVKPSKVRVISTPIWRNLQYTKAWYSLLAHLSVTAAPKVLRGRASRLMKTSPWIWTTLALDFKSFRWVLTRRKKEYEQVNLDWTRLRIRREIQKMLLLVMICLKTHRNRSHKSQFHQEQTMMTSRAGIRSRTPSSQPWPQSHHIVSTTVAVSYLVASHKQRSPPTKSKSLKT